MFSRPIQIVPDRKPVREWTPKYINEILFPEGLALVDNQSSYARVQGLLKEIEYFRECNPYDEYDAGCESLLSAYLSNFKHRRMVV